MKFKWLNSLTVALILTSVSLFAYTLDLTFFRLLEYKAYDAKMRFRGTRPVSGQVVIVAVDEKSLKQEGRWPWPRTLLARLVDRLTEAGAAVIGFDVFFPEKDDNIPAAAVKQLLHDNDPAHFNRETLAQWFAGAGDADGRFAQAITRSGRTVLSYFAYPAGVKSDAAGKMNTLYSELLENSQYAIVQRSDSPEHPVPLRVIDSVGMSLPELVKGANASGFVSFLPEIDGVIRWVPLVMDFKQTLFPPLSLQILQQATQLPLAVRIAPFGVAQVRMGNSPIPTNETGDLLVNFYGPGYTFPHISAADILAGKIDPARLANKIVIVGATAAGAHDLHTSPYGPLYPGVEVHANIIENVLQGDFLRQPEWLRILDVGMILGSGLLLGVTALYFRAIATAVIVLVGGAGYLFVDHYLFTRMGLWTNVVYPFLSQLFVFTGITVYRFAFEEREKRFIRQAFGQYLAPAVIERLMDNPDLLKLGGEQKRMTAFFSDVAGFSTISEKLTPPQLVDLLNEYLTAMTDIVHKFEGTIDKYEGDAIIAFFGAPIPHPDHAARACLASLEMQKALAEMRADWKKQGRAELTARIGLNTGMMVVGNMGSRARMDYTIMGDSVNLASRLEGVNKEYGTHIMISHFTFEDVKDVVETRELDRIRVVGKREPVSIYEVLSRKGELDARHLHLRERFAAALALYRGQKWEEAQTVFGEVQALDPDDKAPATFIERCWVFKAEDALGKGLPADWDGVFEMTSK